MQQYHLTKTQLGIYIESRARKEEPIYHIASLTELKAEADLTQVADAMKKAAAAHAFPKIRLATDSEGEPYQYLQEGAEIDLVLEKMSDEEFARQKSQWPQAMPLEHAPLAHFRLIETPSAKWLYQVFHHTICDGRSVLIFFQDIERALQGLDLVGETVSITDGVLREEAERQTPAYEEAKQWYAREFGGIDVQTRPLPDIDSHSPQAADPKTKMVSKLLKVSHKDLFEASRRLGVKLSVLTDGAFGYMAGLFTGSTEAFFSTVYDSRQSDETRHTMAMMVNTLPVYCKWQPHTTVVDYLAALQAQREEAKKHSLYSYAEACAQLQLPHDLMFSYRGSVVVENGTLGKTLDMTRLFSGDGLAWVLDHTAAGLQLRAEYRCDQYSDAFIQSMASAYEYVLGAMLTARELSEIALVDSREQTAYDSRWHKELAYDQNKSMVDLWVEQVARTPDGTAIVAGSTSLSYRQIDVLSDQVASFLLSQGVGKGKVVAVLIPRNEFMAIASLGVLKSGAAYQPLDPSYPAERLNFMVQDSAAAYLIADEALSGKIEGLEDRTLFTKDIAFLPYAKPACRPGSQDPFILLYTSGTTGTPKGCRLIHANLVDFVHVVQEIYHYDPNSRVTAYASYGFDANMFDLYPGLTHGAAIHIIGEDIRFDMVALNEYFAAQGITHCFMTTQVARTYASSVEAPASLKYLSCGGESFIPVPVPGTYKMYNLYGPTESTVFVTYQLYDKEYDRIPIGAALPNTRLYVVDAHGKPLPPFACGELWIAGRQVASGYLNRPEKTAEVFIPNPFTQEEGYQTVYRTGDVVRRLADGKIDFIGRRDGQVKIRGFRIELSELEAVIREYPQVKDATVIACNDPAGGQFLAAYIVADQKVDMAEFNAFIAARKPIYMVPAVTLQIDKIPLNQNQKVDKRALPKPEYKPQEAASDAPRSLNALEKALQSLVASVLKVENASVTTPLELLGLSSISSIKLAMAIYKRFGVDLKTQDLLGYNTIESVENHLLAYWMDEHPVQEAHREETENPQLPLTISQQGVYADCMRRPESTTYNIPLLYRFPLTQDVEKLADGVRKVFAAHPYLQTYFTLSGVDVAHTFSHNKDIAIDIQQLTEEQFAEFKAGFVRPFNLHKAPLYRVAVVRTEKAVYLLIDIHHIIFDGSSLSVLTGQLQTLLNGGELTPESHTYPDYIRKEASIDKEANKRYFATLLQDCEAASELTADLVQKDDQQGEGLELFEYLPFEEIEEFCRKVHITPAALCLSATGYAISRFTGSCSAYLNTVSTGRNDVHFADTLGMFVKTLPVAVHITEGSNAEFALQTSRMLRATVEHEVYPYSDICRDYNYAPHIMYEYQLGLEEGLVVDGQKVERENFGSDTLKFKIAVRVELREGRPALIVYYKNGLYSRALMRRLARGIVLVAQQMVAYPEGKVCSLSLVDCEDRRLLEQFSAPCKNVDIPIKVFYRMFEAQVDKAPDKEILVAADGRFTYAQLEKRANSVANHLRALGLQKDENVLVLLSRTSRFFSAVFGVSKAGGVFIPSHPDYPADRIRTIMEDSGARFVITEGELLGQYDRALDITVLEAYAQSTRPCVEVLPQARVYMIYTSGTTGKPKGVELRHESICNYLTDHEVNLQVHQVLEQGTCYGAVTTVAFDMSFKEWALALCNGMKLVFASDAETLDPMALARRLQENGVDVFNATPSRLQQYMEVDSFAQVIAQCKVILSGGERYPVKLLDLLRESTRATILNTYGPTEITVSSNGANLTHTQVITVGRPLLNYREYIVDAHDNLLPVGVVGELIICGVGVGNGYHNLPEQTQKAFFTFHGERAYRSGDYARWLPDGTVEILGRKDNQVKIRGLRIELGEIEKVMTRIPGVKSGIILIKKLGNQEALCAYYTLEEGSPLTTEQIKAEMATHLTDYMVPSAFVQLGSMPLTPNGKVNTKALPEPKPVERARGREAVGEKEKLFARIFREVLELDYVSADDSFFDLGGSSLTVTRVVIAASKAGVDLTYAEVFDHPTPAGLAALKGSDARETVLYPAFENLADYDYSAINKLLRNNTLDAFRKGSPQNFSHVLLTGATGFLGIHMLYELLHNYPHCRVTCLLRSKDGVSAQMRIYGLFFYYFEESPKDVFAQRLSVVEGDITQKECFAQCKDLGIDLVLNCAANVKHFSKGTDIEDVNYYGTLHLIDYCQAVGARLVHVSTMSVGGAFVGKDPTVTQLEETMLYYGQQQVSKYTQSKFLAERAVLQAVAQGRLSAKIMRVGTLAPRNKDGEYQINYGTNSFMARMKSTYLVGAHSFESQVATFELSPIDWVAKAILLLTNTPEANVVFHPFNNHPLLMGDLYHKMSALGYPSVAMEEADYQAALEEAEQDPKKAAVLTGLLAYRQGHGVKTFTVGKAAPLTVAVLSRLGYHWPMTDMDYTERFIVALSGLGFFR